MPRIKAFDEQAVLDKAVNLFWEKGFHATSMADLVEHLGINRASLYTTFGNKQKLFHRAFHQYLSTNIEATQQLLTTEEDVRIGLRKLLRLAISQSVNDAKCRGCFVTNIAAELPAMEASMQTTKEDKTFVQDLKSSIQSNKSTFEQAFYNYLKKGVESGQIEKGKNIDAIAALIYIYYNGLKVVAKVEQNEDALAATSEALISLLD
ncbi:MAG: helix-turn-helix domain-containing protein [Bacteroidota bacterium]